MNTFSINDYTSDITLNDSCFPLYEQTVNSQCVNVILQSSVLEHLG